MWIDLVWMKSQDVEYEGKTYWYILSLMDIFSRFHWLAPLQRKLSLQVDAKLDRIFVEYGSPERIQSDNGGEFKKEVIEVRIHCLHHILWIITFICIIYNCERLEALMIYIYIYIYIYTCKNSLNYQIFIFFYSDS